jgi:hypothetical protein
MTVNELKSRVRSELSAAYPTVTIQIEQLGDDPCDLGVSVFGVEHKVVKWVKDRILDLDEELCCNTEFVLTPLVRNKETTQKYYPQFLSPWTAQVEVAGGLPSKISMVNQTETLILISEKSDSKWVYPKTYANVTNEELALAA